MRFAIARLDLQRLLAGGDRFVEPALPHVEAGQLGDDVGGLRIELGGALERGDRAGDVVGGFEMPAEQELRVRVAGSIAMASARRPRRASPRPDTAARRP